MENNTSVDRVNSAGQQIAFFYSLVKYIKRIYIVCRLSKVSPRFIHVNTKERGNSARGLT